MAKNPPRKTSIRGQRHMLAYITPGEAELLKAHGGSGELHNGIPAFPPGGRAGGDVGGRGRGSGGPSRDGPDDKDRSGPRGGRGGGRASAGMSTARSPGGQFGGGGREDRPRQIDVLKAKAQTQAQIEAAKKAEEAAALKAKNQGLLQNFLDYMNPASRLNAVQNMAAKAMGQKFLDVLETDPKATVVRSNGRVVGVRDQYGRLTGRDPAQERAMQDRDGPEMAEERRRRLAAATTPTPTTPGAKAPTLGKRVIRTELAKETEAERLAGRRLGKRSLLSRATTLGA